MEILISNRQSLIDPEEIRRISLPLFKTGQFPEGEVSLLLVEDREMARYNSRYRGGHGPTNVLAFPMKEGLFPEINPSLWGDVVISTETARKEAEEAGLPLIDRLRFLLIHGLLHLMGYDHERSPAEARKMEWKTRKILSSLEAEKKEETLMTPPPFSG